MKAQELNGTLIVPAFIIGDMDSIRAEVFEFY